MKPIQKLLLGFYALLISILSLIFIAFLAGWERPAESLARLTLQDAAARWGSGVLAAALVLLGVYSLFSFIKSTGQTWKDNQVFIREGELGQVSVSLNALENVVEKAARQVEGIRDIRPYIKRTPEGIAVYLKAVVAPAISVPKMSEDLQERVQERIRGFSGITAVEIRISVENVAQEGKTAKL